MNLSFEIDARPLLAAGDRLFSDLVASSESALRDVAGDAVMEMMHLTPPGSFSARSDNEARIRGRINVKNDALSVLRPLPGVAGETAANVMRRHRRQSDGRVSKPATRIVVSEESFQAHLKRELAMVGYTASGWVPAASALGRSAPSWIKNQGGQGHFSIQFAGDRWEIVAENRVEWFSEMHGIPARMNSVLVAYEEPLRLALEAALEKSRRAAGFT